MTNHEVNPRPFIKDEFKNDLDTVNELVSHIADQNDRYDLSDAIDSQAIREAVHRGIADEQSDSFIDLVVASSSIPYLDIGRAILESDRQVEVELNAIDEKLAADLALAGLLTSRRKNEINTAYEQERKRVHLDKVYGLKERHNDLLNLYQAAGTPWPLPRAISLDDRRALSDSSQPSMPEVHIEDIIPVTPEACGRSQRVIEQIKKYKVENPILSADIMEYLTSRLGETVSVDDLIEKCYGPVDAIIDKEEYKKYRSKITCALGPMVYGRRIGNILSQEGFTLQYGERRTYCMVDGQRKIEGRFKRIYRVVSTDNFVTNEEQSLCDGQSVVDTWDIDMTSLAEFDEYDSSEEIVATQEEDIEKLQTSDIFENDVEDDTSIDESESQVVEQQHDWRDKLIADTEKAIDQMIEARLFSEDNDEFSLNVIYRNTNSSRIGTKTSCERLVAAGLLKRFSSKDLNAVVLSRDQIVYSYLLNSNPQLKRKSNKKTQEEAIDIVKRVIERRLNELRESSAA